MAKGCTNNEYEEARKQRLEENKKRFEDLGISTISKSLTEIASPAKKSQHRLPKSKSKTEVVVEPRRSSRVRNPVSYREEIGIELPPLRKRSRSNSSSWGSYVARPLDEIKEATDEERACALEAAEALQSNLQSTNPSFIKSMVRSHVYSCFWLGLPLRFCKQHLPETVVNMVLEDENGSEYEAVYIGNRFGLSGGWRAFALDHKLDDGDALVFELIEAAKFKIYIVKAFPDSSEEDGMQISKEEGNKGTTKASKAGSNHDSESNKTKKRKQAIVHETNESASSQDNLRESSIDNDVKPQGVNPTKRTNFSRKTLQKLKSKGISLAEIGEQKAATKLKSQAKKSEESIGHEIGDSSNIQQLLPGNNDAKPQGANAGKKNGIAQDGGSDLKKVVPVQKGSKSVSKQPRKKPAPKLFRKKA